VGTPDAAAAATATAPAAMIPAVSIPNTGRSTVMQSTKARHGSHAKDPPDYGWASRRRAQGNLPESTQNLRTRTSCCTIRTSSSRRGASSTSAPTRSTPDSTSRRTTGFSTMSAATVRSVLRATTGAHCWPQATQFQRRVIPSFGKG
jgi:hypothetical protein